MFTPEGRATRSSAPTRFDKLFTGIIQPRPRIAGEPAGAGSTSTPEDTCDADYGRLLEAAAQRCVKGMASPTGFEPAFWP